MNTLAHLFAALCAAWRADPASEHVERLAADFAARLGASGLEQACVGIVSATQDRAGFRAGLAGFLKLYGVELCANRPSRGRVLIFASLASQGADPEPTPYAGTLVVARRPRPIELLIWGLQEEAA